MTKIEKLGHYIERLDRPNSNLCYGIEDVCGITNTKQLVHGTKANLIGRTFEKFSVLAPREFIFNRRTSRNGERISLGYNTTERDWILTEDYCHFRVRKDKENELDPDYLYLFFLDPEFDRYARFNSWGSATEFFNWEEMIETPIPILPIAQQRKIVHDYHVIYDRIKLLKKDNTIIDALVFHLYEIAVAKSDMVCTISDIGKFVRGSNITAEKMVKGPYDVISAGITPSGCHNKFNVISPSITISGSGVNAGYVSYHFNNIWAADCSYNNDTAYPVFLFCSLKKLKKRIEILKDGNSAQPHVYAKDINALVIPILPKKQIESFEESATRLFNHISANLAEIKVLDEFAKHIIMQGTCKQGV